MKTIKPIKVVMCEYMNDDNAWEWYSITRNTPKQAICDYLFEVDEIDDLTNVKFNKPEGLNNAIYAKDFDVRAYYITII
jgi:hypothetical protein